MTTTRNPLPTVDIIIELPAGQIVLVERAREPLGWALPGGFVEVGESLWQAAVREAAEETGLQVTLTEQLHTYSAPERDPRQHTISTLFIGRAAGEPRGGDDARRAVAAQPEACPPLRFDHDRMLADYLTFRRTGRRPPPRR